MFMFMPWLTCICIVLSVVLFFVFRVTKKDEEGDAAKISPCVWVAVFAGLCSLAGGLMNKIGWLILALIIMIIIHYYFVDEWKRRGKMKNLAWFIIATLLLFPVEWLLVEHITPDWKGALFFSFIPSLATMIYFFRDIEEEHDKGGSRYEKDNSKNKENSRKTRKLFRALKWVSVVAAAVLLVFVILALQSYGSEAAADVMDKNQSKVVRELDDLPEPSIEKSACFGYLPYDEETEPFVQKELPHDNNRNVDDFDDLMLEVAQYNGRDGILPIDFAEAALWVCRHDARNLRKEAIANKVIPPSIDWSELVDGTSLSDKGKEVYWQVVGIYKTSSYEFVDVPSDWYNTGYGPNGLVVSSTPGVSGDLSGTKMTTLGGNEVYVKNNCFNWIVPKPPKDIPTGKTDNEDDDDDDDDEDDDEKKDPNKTPKEKKDPNKTPEEKKDPDPPTEDEKKDEKKLTENDPARRGEANEGGENNKASDGSGEDSSDDRDKANYLKSDDGTTITPSNNNHGYVDPSIVVPDNQPVAEEHKKEEQSGNLNQEQSQMNYGLDPVSSNSTQESGETVTEEDGDGDFKEPI